VLVLLASMEYAARIDLGVIHDAKRRWRRRWTALAIVVCAVALAGAGIALSGGFASRGVGVTRGGTASRARPALRHACLQPSGYVLIPNAILSPSGLGRPQARRVCVAGSVHTKTRTHP
jgi:hypothetical protein